MKICIFASSSKHLNKTYFDAASELGELIGQNGHSLIHGGGKEGLMGTVADHVQLNEGKVIGIIPEKLNLIGVVRENDDQTIVTQSMAERKAKMFELADVFIALPGGFGTLEELFEIITLNQLGYTQKQVIILNINNYYSPLLKQFEKLFEEGFAENQNSLYQVVESADEVLGLLK